MGYTLKEVAEQLKNSNKKVQLIYAFNGIGKTRLSREFKDLVSPKHAESEEETEPAIKILYYNAFTEDLFYWDNDLDADLNRKMLIQPNAFTELAFTFLKDQGQDNNIATYFQQYTHSSVTPKFNSSFSEVTFSILRGSNDSINNIKISKGEESNFIWCVFYSLIEQVIEVLNIAEKSDRSTHIFDSLKYIFIDDPVTSLDENHLIELAVDLAQLIKASESDLKFIITTHNPLFYNVLHNELKKSDKFTLCRFTSGEYDLKKQPDDSPFSYHLFLKRELEKAIETGELKKYHYNFLRNILEKTSTFLGYENWSSLLPDTNDGRTNPYETRIINIASHSKYSGEEVADLTEDDKRVLNYLVKNLEETYHFNKINKE